VSRSTKIAAIYLALVQLLFALSWSIYDLYLPQLTARAGLSKEVSSWLSLADQLLVIFMDIAFGLASPFITKAIGRAGKWIIGAVWGSCLAFLLLPFMTDAGSALFLPLVIFWVVTSSAIRMPVLILLSQNVSRDAIAGFAAIVAIGKGLASAFASYLTSALADVNPSIPFVISSLVIGLAILGLLWVEKNAREREELTNHEAYQPLPVYVLLLFGVGVLLTGTGFQFHGSASAGLYQSVAPKVSLGLLMPIFWVGFHLALYPATLLTKRYGAETALATGAILSAIGCFSATSAGSLPSLLGDQVLTGAGWSLFFMGGIALAISAGTPSKVGIFLASWSALLATSTFIRLALAKTVLPPLVAPTLWLVGALFLVWVVVLYRRNKPG
jgi:hypothetical protein